MMSKERFYLAILKGLDTPWVWLALSLLIYYLCSLVP